jgi:hypothetical protein
MSRAGWKVLHRKKAVQNPAAIDAMSDQDVSDQSIDPTAVLMSEAAALHPLTAQRVNVALTETAAAARSEAVTGKAAAENANEMANHDLDVSLAKAADASEAPATMDEHQEEGKNARGEAVVAEEAAKEMKPARGAEIPRIKPMETRRGDVRSAAYYGSRNSSERGSKPTL